MDIHKELNDYGKSTTYYEDKLSNELQKRISKILKEDIKCRVHIDYSQYIGITDVNGNNYFLDFVVYRDNTPYVRYSKGSKTRRGNKKYNISKERYEQIKQAFYKSLLGDTYE